MKSLSDYRWERAHQRLRRRQANAEIIFDYTEDEELCRRLRGQAWLDYLNEVPEFRKLRRQAAQEM